MWYITPNPSGGTQPNQANIPGGNGWVLSKRYFNQFDKADAYAPMWIDSESTWSPPLIWFRGPNGELGVRRDGSFDDGSEFSYFRYSLNFITISPSFLTPQNYYSRAQNIPPLNPALFETCPGPSTISSMLGDDNGWIGGGPYVYGIGNHNPPTNSYVDDYYNNSAARDALFNAATYPHQDTTIGYPSLANYAAYRAFAASLLLKEEIAMGARIASLTPSRFFIVTSQVLTRQQRLRYEGNNLNAASSDVLGLVYPPSDIDVFLEKTNTLTNFIDPFEDRKSVV
jgi:hypothetical protein